MDVKKRSSDPAAQEMLKLMAKDGIENAWDRLEAQEPRRSQAFSMPSLAINFSIS